MLGSVTRQNVCQPPAPSTMRRLFLFRALLLHQRDELARHEREAVTKIVASTMPGTAKMILRSWSASQGPTQPWASEEQHEDQAGDDRRDGERQVDQRDQEVLSPELELGDAPRGGHAEDEIDRHRDRCGQQREPGRTERVRLPDRVPVRVSPFEKACEKTRTSGSTSVMARKASAIAVSVQRTALDSPVARAMALGAEVA